MNKKDWIRVLRIAIPWGVSNGIVFLIWGGGVQSFFNIGVILVLGIWVFYSYRISKRRDKNFKNFKKS